MEKINIILNKRKFSTPQQKIRINSTWEIADEFAKYVGLNTIYVLKLFKIYGRPRVLNTRSYLKDFPDYGNYKDKSGLIRWKLEEDKAKMA